MSTETSYEDGKLTVTRFYNAPRDAVFNAWMETSKVEQWWGCADATQVESEIEPWVGGRYHHSMTLKQTFDYLHHGIITAYDPPALLAYQMVGPSPDDITQVRVEFTEQGTGTLVCLTQNNLTDDISHFVRAGWTDGLNKLAMLLSAEVINF